MQTLPSDPVTGPEPREAEDEAPDEKVVRLVPRRQPERAPVPPDDDDDDPGPTAA